MSKRKIARASKARSAAAIRSKAPRRNAASRAKTGAHSKQMRVVGLLSRPSGATIARIMQSTGWQPHSVRGFTAAMILAQVLLGFIAGLGGSWAASLVGRQWGLLLGPVLIVL